MYLLFVAACRCIAWCIPPFSVFSTIKHISTLVNNSNSTCVFLMLILMLIKNELDQAHILQYIYFKRLQTHLQVIVYHFEHADHDINHRFLFQSFSTLFFMLIISICNVFYVLATVKIFILTCRCFIKLFPAIHIFVWINTFS